MKSAFTHILLDLEALGLRPGAAVLEIAAVAFDLATGDTGHEFHRHVLPVAPFTSDLETIKWHANRPEPTIYPHPKAIHPREAILHFLDWLDDTFGRDEDYRKTLTFWSWGITYDFPILESLLDLRNPDDAHPFRYHQVSDARTLWKLAFGDLRHDDRPHHALPDCHAAIEDLVRASNELGTASDESTAPDWRDLAGELFTYAQHLDDCPGGTRCACGHRDLLARYQAALAGKGKEAA